MAITLVFPGSMILLEIYSAWLVNSILLSPSSHEFTHSKKEADITCYSVTSPIRSPTPIVFLAAISNACQGIFSPRYLLLTLFSYFLNIFFTFPMIRCAPAAFRFVTSAHLKTNKSYLIFLIVQHNQFLSKFSFFKYIHKKIKDFYQPKEKIYVKKAKTFYSIHCV